MTLDLANLSLPPGLEDNAARARILNRFATEVYGAIPPASVPKITRDPLPGVAAQRVGLSFEQDARRFQVDAALWCPDDARVRKVIVLLDFLGPVGVLTHAYPIDPHAVIQPPEVFGAETRLTETMRGATAYRVPIDQLLSAGFAVLVSCYGSWAPDCPTAIRNHGVGPLMHSKSGAISLWAWAYQRMIDAAYEFLDRPYVALAGHSRLGKAALWAAAIDTRVDAVFANQSGCFGAASHASPEGETAAQLIARFPHWVIATGQPSIDQHVLLATIAPRRLYLGQAKLDNWADPLGSLAALEAASAAWPEPNDSVGAHLRDGGHDLLPYDWTQFLAFLGR